uniref:Uncharacterized protein n=1 Tax=Parascaris equorum TaxID=6256 RepID=A0A914S5K6_PAREQ
MLLPSLPNFNSLPSSCLDLIVLFLERQSSIGDYDRLSAKVTFCLKFVVLMFIS